MKACNRIFHTHDYSRFRFVPVSVRGGMQPYHRAIKEEKLLSSKKVKLMSFLQRYWKGVSHSVRVLLFSKSPHPNVLKIGRQSDESQGITTTESSKFNPCDGVGYCDPHQGFTTIESRSTIFQN